MLCKAATDQYERSGKSNSLFAARSFSLEICESVVAHEHLANCGRALAANVVGPETMQSNKD
jgi:hypothetical protein